MGRYEELEELEVYQIAVRLADRVWELVSEWPSFARDTLGKQLVRAADSIGANIAEAYGRFHYGERIQHLYYSRGSLYETRHWIHRGHIRGLIASPDHIDLSHQLHILAPKLNAYIASKKRQRASNQVTK
jgi:four helix bundle protein